MRFRPKGFLIRLVGSALLSGLLFLWVLVPIPIPRWAWPVLWVLASPFVFVWELIGYSPSVPAAVTQFLIVGTLTYTTLSYVVPPAVRMLRHASVALALLSRASMSDPLRFGTYFGCGAVVGGMIGAAIWAEWRYFDSRVAWVTSSAIMIGWAAAVVRFTVGRRRAVP